MIAYPLGATPRAIGPSKYVVRVGQEGLHVPMELVGANLRIPMLSKKKKIIMING